MKIRLIITFCFLTNICFSQKVSTYWFDVVGDSIKEKITVERDSKKAYLRNIFLSTVKNSKQKICSISVNEKYANTSPPVENVYLEANNIQSAQRGFRIIVRNTDQSPDILYLDLQFKKVWKIMFFGIINTSEDTRGPFICTFKADRKLADFKYAFGDNMEIRMNYFGTYFNTKFDCK